MNTVNAYNNSEAHYLPTILGGRYGLFSTRLTSAMAIKVFAELNKKHPKKHFTLGIEDDETQPSWHYDGT